ncbi:hypothetical protein XaC1_88 [Xanthomonas phage XaC1]|nr:hypothetical protein XaC1_88 [Xanthomonas phage XaC1]
MLKKKTALEVLEYVKSYEIDYQYHRHDDYKEHNGSHVYGTFQDQYHNEFAFFYYNTVIVMDYDGSFDIEMDYGLEEYYLGQRTELNKDDYFNFSLEYNVQIPYEVCLEIIEYFKKLIELGLRVNIKYGMITLYEE